MKRRRIKADERDLTPAPGGPRNGTTALGGLVSKGTVASVRCQATSKQSGEQCKRWAIIGGTVCAMHGGMTPAVRKAAHDRILALRPLAQKVLREAMSLEEVPWSQRVRAASIVIDHTEPKQPELHLHQHQVTEMSEALDRRIAEAMATRFGPVPELESGEILDAEVIEDGPSAP